MASKSEKDRAKQIQDRCQNILLQMLKDEDNKYCVDCDAKGPRWASWNLGIFLCIRCAGIHRNLGVHISKVKSVNLDSWTPEQVVSLQQMGNSRARAVYEANLPDSFRRPQNDSSLEGFIRAKYETRKYIAKEWVPAPTPKVNWDKEIDEEMERQKKKKKSTSASGVGPLPAPALDKKYNKSDVIPSIPKPKSSVSPKLARSTPQAQPEPSKPSNGAADLLGLDTSRPETKPADDIFSSFFSASDKPAETKPTETKPDLKTEEENFFNQAAPSASEKSKLTKDSILALYSQTPATNLSNQFSTPSYPSAYQFQGFNSAPQNGAQNTFSSSQGQNSMPAQFSSQQQNQMQSATFGGQPQNGMQPQFTSSQTQNGIQASPFSNTQAQQNSGMQFNTSNNMQQFTQFQGSFQPAFPTQPGFQAFQQPAFTQPQQGQQLNQQFGNMNIGQNFPNFAQNSNVSWQ